MKYLKKINESEICYYCKKEHTLDINHIKEIFADFSEYSKYEFGHYSPDIYHQNVEVCHILIDFRIKATIGSGDEKRLSNNTEVFETIAEISPCLNRLADSGMSFGYSFTSGGTSWGGKILGMAIFIWETK